MEFHKHKSRVVGVPVVQRQDADAAPPLALQIAFITRRLGTVDPATLAALAGLAFQTMEGSAR